MPIKPENQARYPKDWKKISLSIRERSGWKCEFCGLANGTEGYRMKDGTFYSLEHIMSGYIPEGHETELLTIGDAGKKPMKIILTVAHLDHTPENCDAGNLKALCQRCHLNYDKHHHAQNAKATNYQKRHKGQLPLF